MNLKNLLLSLFPALAIVGCSTIADARKAQSSIAALANNNAPMTTRELSLKDYSLQQLVDFAMTNRPSMRSAALKLEDARLALKSIAAEAPLVSSTPWNSLDLSVSASHSESSAGSHFDDMKWKTDGNPSASLSLDILIYDFGRNDADLKAQVENVIAAELECTETGYTVFNEVANAYFTLLEQCALLEVAHTNEYEYALHVDQAQKRLDAGEAMKLDLLRAKLDLAQAKEKTVAAQLKVRTAGAEMMRSLGIDAAQGERSEIMEFEGNALSFALKGFPRTKYTVKEAYAIAHTNAPVMKVARAKLRSASAGVDRAIADLYPTISASTSLRWTDPLWYFNWGFSAAQSLFTGFKKTTAVERAVVTMQQSEADIYRIEQELSRDLETAIASRDNAREAERTAAESYAQALENRSVVNEQYEQGDVSRVEYTDSVSAYVQALGSRISAFYDWQRSEAALFAEIGMYPVYEERKFTEEVK